MTASERLGPTLAEQIQVAIGPVLAEHGMTFTSKWILVAAGQGAPGGMQVTITGPSVQEWEAHGLLNVGIVDCANIFNPCDCGETDD